jgi:SAM-dependent methyltransferase
LHPSEYKELSQALAVKGTRVVAELSSPMGLITVVESPVIPFRHAPGMSLNAVMEPPPQLGIFNDGDGPSALTHYDGRREPLAYLDELTSALPYHLLERPRVLVLGSGAGADVLQALYHRAHAIDAVELNPQLIDLVQFRFAAFSGAPYSESGIRVHIGEARGFIAGHSDRFDLIQVALVDAFGASSAGLYALSESYLYTVEALQEYLDHLEPGGMLAITRWVNLPPRDALKLFATAVEALERRGVGQPAQQLALVRGWKTATLLVKGSAFTQPEIAALKTFCRTRSFDVAYYPGIEAGEANRYNVLERPDFHDGALALLGAEREAYLARYKFNIVPASDDRPYFFQFFKWSTLPELLALRERGGLPLLNWYLVLIAALTQAVLVAWCSSCFHCGSSDTPPAMARGRHGRDRDDDVIRCHRSGVHVRQIAFIQSSSPLLAHPLHAVAVALCASLVFAGLGSR